MMQMVKCALVSLALMLVISIIMVPVTAVSPAGSPGPISALNSHDPHRFVAVTVGDCFLMALRDDGTVWTWGNMYCGEPAYMNVSGRMVKVYYWTEPAPVQVPVSNVTAIAAGGDFCLALKNDGTVWAWGYNGYGELGDGTTTGTSRGNISIVQVKGLENVTAISAVSLNGLALKNDGTVWAWGSNWGGQVGDGTRIDRLLPVQVKGLSNITSIWGGSFAIADDGTVWTWGTTFSGKAGAGPGIDIGIPIPFQVPGLTNVKAIDTDETALHTIFLKYDGTVWGWNTPTSLEQFIPVQVQAKGFSNITAVQACGGGGSMALKDDGTVWIWGNDASGQLAMAPDDIGTYYTGSSTPVKVRDLNGIIAISSHYSNSLFLKDDGSVWVCGDGSYGEAGNGAFLSHIYTPIKVLGPDETPTVLPISPPDTGMTDNNAMHPDNTTGLSANAGRGIIQNNGFLALVAVALFAIIIAMSLVYMLITRKR